MNTHIAHADLLPHIVGRGPAYLLDINGTRFDRHLIEHVSATELYGMPSVTLTVWFAEVMVEMTLDPDVHVVVATEG